MRKIAPIVLFVYNRLALTAETIEALKKNEYADESVLYIFSDGPASPEDQEKIQEVRSYLKSISGFKDIIIKENSQNIGLADSIIGGVTDIVKKYGKIIVLEDDLVTAPCFLKYMNDALTIYENEEKVVSIHGYTWPIEKKDLQETFFLKGADSWGWATWERGWKYFNPNGKELLSIIKKRKSKNIFDLKGSYGFYLMLKAQVNGKIDSWAIRWRASAFINDMLTLYPKYSLVKNIGLVDGTHCNTKNTPVDINDFYFPDSLSIERQKVEENSLALKRRSEYYRKNYSAYKRWLIYRGINKFIRILKK